MLNIVLVEPEIPQNTGNIARTCAAIGARLILIEPMGFSIDDKHVKRAGLDYWDKVEIIKYDSIDEFFTNNKGPFYFASTKSKHIYSEVKYEDDCYILFGKETKGLPEKILHDNYDKCIRIPMRNTIRSLNLANSVAIVAYEYERQKDFNKLENYGHLREYEDV